MLDIQAYTRSYKRRIDLQNNIRNAEMALMSPYLISDTKDALSKSINEFNEELRGLNHEE